MIPKIYMKICVKITPIMAQKVQKLKYFLKFKSYIIKLGLFTSLLSIICSLSLIDGPNEKGINGKRNP